MKHSTQLLVTTLVPLIPAGILMLVFPHRSSVAIAAMIYVVMLSLVNKTLR